METAFIVFTIISAMLFLVVLLVYAITNNNKKTTVAFALVSVIEMVLMVLIL